MDPLSYKEFTLILPVQIHLSYFNLSSLIHLLAVLMFLSGPTLRDVGIHVTDFYNQLLQLGSNILPNGAAQIGLPLRCQLFFFHCCSHPHKALATIQESV